VRRLIVNADDFALTSGVNRGILEAHRRGIVTSATLMACGSEFQEAVALAKQAPTLSVGCHVLLVDATPMLDLPKVSSLVFENSGVFQFRESLARFAMLAVTGRLDEQQIEAEVTAQIRKLQETGIQLSHLDSHKHTHMFPAVFRPMLRAAKNCGIRAVRNPFEPLLFTGISHLKRRFQLGILRSFRASFRQALTEAGMSTPDGCIGIVATGGLSLETFQALMENLPQGTWEFVSHPGYNDAALSSIKTRLRAAREVELELLTSVQVKELLARESIELISYRDFASSGKASPEVLSPSGVTSD
jgi:chitin disaccharide deacetylase